MLPRGRTILCIDDDWNALINRKICLEQQGYRVIESTDADEGLQLLCARNVDAVVLDYHLAGRTGDVVAARMKGIKVEVPILLLSAYGPLPPKKLRSVDLVIYKAQETKMLESSLRKLLSKPSPFFDRWLIAWRDRTRTVSR